MRRHARMFGIILVLAIGALAWALFRPERAEGQRR